MGLPVAGVHPFFMKARAVDLVKPIQGDEGRVPRGLGLPALP
jgi:hypothetical protein